MIQYVKSSYEVKNRSAEKTESNRDINSGAVKSRFYGVNIFQCGHHHFWLQSTGRAALRPVRPSTTVPSQEGLHPWLHDKCQHLHRVSSYRDPRGRYQLSVFTLEGDENFKSCHDHVSSGDIACYPCLIISSVGYQKHPQNGNTKAGMWFFLFIPQKEMIEGGGLGQVLAEDSIDSSRKFSQERMSRKSTVQSVFHSVFIGTLASLMNGGWGSSSSSSWMAKPISSLTSLMEVRGEKNNIFHPLPTDFWSFHP